MANPTLTANKFRLLLDVSQPSVAPASLQLPSGAELEIDVMCFNSTAGAFGDAATITNWSNINNVVCALQSTNDPHAGTTYWSAAVANAAIVQNCTAANWTNGSSQQLQFIIPSSVNNTAVIGASQPLWLCIYGVTTDAPANFILLAAFQVQIFDSGIPAQIGVWYLLGPDNLVHAVTLVAGVGDQLALSVDQAGRAAPGVSAPFLAAPDGTYRLPTLVKLADGTFAITLV